MGFKESHILAFINISNLGNLFENFEITLT